MPVSTTATVTPWPEGDVGGEAERLRGRSRPGRSPELWHLAADVQLAVDGDGATADLRALREGGGDAVDQRKLRGDAGRRPCARRCGGVRAAEHDDGAGTASLSRAGTCRLARCRGRRCRAVTPGHGASGDGRKDDARAPAGLRQRRMRAPSTLNATGSRLWADIVAACECSCIRCFVAHGVPSQGHSGAIQAGCIPPHGAAVTVP